MPAAAPAVAVPGHVGDRGPGETGTPGGAGGGGGAGAAIAGTRSTRLTASIFEMAVAGDADTAWVSAGAAGQRFVGAGLYGPFPFVVGAVPATESSACQALGAEVARAIRGALDDGRR
jgi:hypothetical protein